MADIAQVFATGGTALVSAAAGAGLTYWLGALNRRHQEAREDATRWYEARREAYEALLIAASRLSRKTVDSSGAPEQSVNELAEEMTAAISAVRLVGTRQAIEAADSLYVGIFMDNEHYEQKLMEIGPQLDEATGEDAALLEEELANARRVDYMLEARKVFEEAARQDLGHPSP